MFWTDWGQSPKIERSTLNGEYRISIATSGLVWPNDVTIDFQDDRLYWTDAFLDKIEVADYDGSNRRQLFYRAGIHPFGVAVFSNSLYWTDWANARQVMQIEKTSGTVQGGFSFPGGPMGLVVYDSSRQPSGEGTALAAVALTPVVLMLLA